MVQGKGAEHGLRTAIVGGSLRQHRQLLDNATFIWLCLEIVLWIQGSGSGLVPGFFHVRDVADLHLDSG